MVRGYGLIRLSEMREVRVLSVCYNGCSHQELQLRLAERQPYPQGNGAKSEGGR
jgi:hypothetical protein